MTARSPHPLLLLLPLALLAACGPPPAENAVGSDAFEPESVEIPALDNLPSPAPEQIRELQERLGVAAGDAELAQAYGELGELLHAYQLTDPAAACYRNARKLAPGEARWPYLLAVLAQGEGRAEKALELLEEVLGELEPGDQPARLRLADLHMARGEPDLARPLYRAALEADPGSAAALFGLGRVDEAAGDLEAAASAYERALELQPAARNLHSLLASLYRRLGDEAGAERHLAGFGGGTVTFEDPYFEAMSARREGLGPLLAQALDAFAKGDFETALGHYLAALELDPASAAALSGAAGSLRKSGQMQRASDLLAGLLEADPGNRLARLELATTQIETGQLEAAIAGFGSLIERDPDFDKAHFGLGIAQGRAGRWPLAAESFRRTLELSPKDQNARFHLALALIQQGSLDAAVATLERTVREAPSFLRARQRLGDLLFSSQRLPEAEEQFRAVAAMEAEAPPQERALAYYQLGRLQMARDEIPGATADFERAVALLPELWQAHIALGHRYRSAARFIDAASSFSSAAAINPEHVAARIFEAQALIAGGEYARARARLEQGLADLPRAAQLGYALAHLLSSAPDAAVRDGARALKLATSLDRALPSPAHGEAVAMALAELGRFEEAAERQQRLIDSALEARKSPIPRPDAPGPEDLARLEENLRGYQNRQPVRLGGASSS